MRKINTMIADSNTGFVTGIDPDSARRQFNMSLGLAIVVTIATLATAMTSGIQGSSRSQEVARAVVHSPSFVPVYQASHVAPQSHGG
jgi:hypothetical protein